MSDLKKKVRDLERKIMSNSCEDCDCLDVCRNKELKNALELKIGILENNLTVTK
jgi:hypothetical protein